MLYYIDKPKVSGFGVSYTTQVSGISIQANTKPNIGTVWLDDIYFIARMWPFPFFSFHFVPFFLLLVTSWLSCNYPVYLFHLLYPPFVMLFDFPLALNSIIAMLPTWWVCKMPKAMRYTLTGTMPTLTLHLWWEIHLVFLLLTLYCELHSATTIKSFWTMVSLIFSGDLWVNGPLEQTSQTGPIISFSYPPINRTEGRTF